MQRRAMALVAAAAALALTAIVLAVGCLVPWGGQSGAGDLIRVTARTTGEHAGTADMSATGDFDGDGSPDEAYFAESNGKYLLVISLSGQRAPVLRERRAGTLATTGVRTQPPGRYAAYCAARFARGGSDCSEGTLRELFATHDAIELFSYEAAAVLLYWEEGRLHTLYWVD